MTGDNEEFRFVSLLALELENADISLPSLPDVVMKIRKMLQDENSDFEQISRAVSLDPVLVSRLFVFANSAFYNRANIRIETVDGAIGRLGVEVVRNTAMSMAMKQLYTAEKHSHADKLMRAVWARGMKLSCMSYAIARHDSKLSDETAFLCGLLNEVGKLYIITKAEDFPNLLGERKSFNLVLEKWNAQISKSIIESWGFSDEVAQSADPDSYLDHESDSAACFVDVVYVAKRLIDHAQEEALDFAEESSCVKLKIDDQTIGKVMDGYREKLKTMQQTLA